MSIASELERIVGAKEAIRLAIVEKGVPVDGSEPLEEYAAYVGELSGYGAWVRPADWLPLEALGEGDEGLVGLVAVFDSEGEALSLSASGAYRVEWGDGVVEEYAAGARADHLYDYASLPGTECSRGYRQAVVRLSAQAPGALTSLDLQERPAIFPGADAGSRWLDIEVAGGSLSALAVGGSTVRTSMLERCRCAKCAVTDLGGLFSRCDALAVVPFFDASAATGMEGMFSGCSSLLEASLVGSRSVSTVASMFYDCTALQRAPSFDTSAVTDMSSMFYGCRSLRRVPLFDTAAVTSVESMFEGCGALQELPLLQTGSVTDMGRMLRDCCSLLYVPPFDTASVVGMREMFYGCRSLLSVPPFETGSVTDMSYMFGRCSSLQRVPLFDTASVTNMTAAFSYAYALAELPALEAGSVTAFGPAIFTPGAFQGCASLRRFGLQGVGATFSVAGCGLGPVALDELYMSLAVVSSRTVTVTGNWGTGGDHPEIATAKGWTVTG
ncbi:BspA family leucine-rich repeat surface protein [Chlorobium sp. N1]|uniref:BspA family leucine-rich repeat surface protein n=1 Tax=Chlorobium sp. N1 TaxID=2491138 RepID=UPI00103878D4|nr:BspA family leucine-rich repeat surface protein [Chlorobium sp. N1]TCD47016.1 BspA family leucine-rich repeat surface protein [Chlorobium sp. N1]